LNTGVIAKVVLFYEEERGVAGQTCAPSTSNIFASFYHQSCTYETQLFYFFY